MQVYGISLLCSAHMAQLKSQSATLAATQGYTLVDVVLYSHM